MMNWAAGPYFIDITINGTNIGSSPLLSVPYALFAASGNAGPEGPKGDIGEQGIPGPKGEPGDAVWAKEGGNINYSEGRVGIGIDSPAEELDVDGNIHVSGDVIVDGNIVIEELRKEISILKGKAGIGEITDIAGNVYRTIKIGKQIWMAENLNVSYFADGSAIPLVESNSSWNAVGYTDYAYCWPNNDPLSGSTYCIFLPNPDSDSC
jgi:hypothetical protein